MALDPTNLLDAGIPAAITRCYSLPMDCGVYFCAFVLARSRVDISSSVDEVDPSCSSICEGSSERMLSFR